MPKTFKIRSAQEVQEQKIMAMVEELSRMMEDLGRKVKAIEEKLATQPAPPMLGDQTAAPPITEPEGPS